MDYSKTPGGLLMPQNNLQIGGVFEFEHVRGGKIIDRWADRNLVVNEGLNAILNIMLHGASQIPTWYIGLFEANYTPVSTVTAATITAASTECSAYDEATRVAYNEAAASGQSITNSANKAEFTFNASKTIYGGFLVSNSTKNATTGTLLAATKFTSGKAVEDDDQLLVTYTLSASST